MRPVSLPTHAVALLMLGFAASGALMAAPNVGAAGPGSEATVTIDNFVCTAGPKGQPGNAGDLDQSR